jgi:hypothetical protein
VGVGRYAFLGVSDGGLLVGGIGEDVGLAACQRLGAGAGRAREEVGGAALGAGGRDLAADADLAALPGPVEAECRVRLGCQLAALGAGTAGSEKPAAVSASVVASDIACGSKTPAAIAAANHSVNRVTGSAGARPGSKSGASMSTTGSRCSRSRTFSRYREELS